VIKRLLGLSITKYFGISCMAGIIDFGIAYVVFKIGLVNYLMACNLGIVLGFIFQYYICRQYIFSESNYYSFFIIYIATFLLGFILADITMWVCFNRIYLPFIISKAMSMLIPFFIIYFLRKSLLGLRRHKGYSK
jgi:putative flippase GtrA